MSEKTKTHLPSLFSVYLIVSAVFALGADALRRHSIAGEITALRSGSEGITIALISFSILIGTLYWKFGTTQKVIRWHQKLLKHAWYFCFAWIGAGLASFAIAECVSGSRVVNPLVAAITGPLAGLLSGNSLLVLILLVIYSVVLGEWFNLSEIGKHADGKDAPIKVAKKIRDLVGNERASKDPPVDAHFVETVGPISQYVIEDDDLPKMVTFGVAQLAAGWGKKKFSTELGLPFEGSGLLIGAPASGKTLLGHRAILNTEKADPKKGVLQTKWIVLSIKPRDIAGVVTPYLRSLGMKVEMWDLTGKTTKSDRYGDPTRWSPNSSCPNYDKAKKMGKRIVESSRDHDARGGSNKFWLEQCTIIVAVSLLASHLRNASHETAMTYAQLWNDPEAIDVEAILGAHGADDGAAAALHDWREIRSTVLDRDPENGEWVKKPSGGQGSVTGDNINTTLSGLMTEIATQAAYDATANPKLVPREWIRAEEGSALFLIGNMREKGMTRSLLAPALEELLIEAAEYANEHDDERLPFRLIIFADELANLAPIEDLQEWFATNRSARIQFIAVFQSYAQAELVYSPAVARTLLDASAAIVVLSGVNDPDLIRDLNTMGGSKRVELNDGNVTTHALIEGQQLMELRRPNSKTGKSGQALMIMTGGVAEIEIPIWTMEKRYDDRGEVMPQHKEATEKLRAKLDPWGKRRKRANDVFNRYKNRRLEDWHRRDPLPPARPFIPRPGDGDEEIFVDEEL
jgi:hypothetical protein